MKTYAIFLGWMFVPLTVLVLATFAWVALNRDRVLNQEKGLIVAAASPSTIAGSSAESSDSKEGDVISVDILNPDFPTTEDAFNLANIGDGSLVYQTQMSPEQVMEFYRDTYSAKGYLEREALITASDESFKLVFDGDSSGQAVVIQSEDSGDGSQIITLRLEDL